jgi:hypothetical protein
MSVDVADGSTATLGDPLRGKPGGQPCSRANPHTPSRARLRFRLVQRIARFLVP